MVGSIVEQLLTDKDSRDEKAVETAFIGRVIAFGWWIS